MMTYVPKFWKLRSKLTGGGVDILSAVVAGAGVNTNIAVTGIKPNAQILACVNLTDDTNQVGNVTAVTAGNFKLSTDMTGKTLFVLYAQRHN